MVRALSFNPCGWGLIPELNGICGFSLLLLYSASRGFSLGTPVFPSPQNPIFRDSNSIRKVDEELLCGCATSNSLYIISIFYSFIIL